MHHTVYVHNYWFISGYERTLWQQCMHLQFHDTHYEIHVYINVGKPEQQQVHAPYQC